VFDQVQNLNDGLNGLRLQVETGKQSEASRCVPCYRCHCSRWFNKTGISRAVGMFDCIGGIRLQWLP